MVSVKVWWISNTWWTNICKLCSMCTPKFVWSFSISGCRWSHFRTCSWDELHKVDRKISRSLLINLNSWRSGTDHVTIDCHCCLKLIKFSSAFMVFCKKLQIKAALICKSTKKRSWPQWQNLSVEKTRQILVCWSVKLYGTGDHTATGAGVIPYYDQPQRNIVCQIPQYRLVL